ncbi:MAG: hypothetical protein U0840_23860 [Gemmataceae bacterium]
MYCSNCGHRASGNFCTQCGQRLDLLEALPVDDTPERALVDWREEHRYQVLLKVDAVRERIARYGRQAQKGLTGEQFLELCDKVLGPCLEMPVSMAKVAKIVMPVYARMGIQTGKTQSEIVEAPIGEVLVSVLCSLARFGREVRRVQQGEDGCVVEASLPSDLWSFEGELVVAVRRHRDGARVDAATKIPGQLYDWGKSKQALEQLFDDLGASMV